MKFNLTEIGGRETGAAAIRPVGTTTLEDALSYANVGRKILGDFKQRLQQGGLKDGRFEQALKDGTVITVVTNMIGLAPIDQIYVDTGNRKLEKKPVRCIGFIMQMYTSFVTFPSEVKVTIPGQDEVFDTSVTWTTLGGPSSREILTPAYYNGFPDNGAKYVDTFLEADGALGDYESPLPIQLVYAMRINIYGSMSPGTPDLMYRVGADVSLPSLGGSYAYQYGAYFNEGVCGNVAGVDITWSVSATPCIRDVQVSASHGPSGTSLTDQTGDITVDPSVIYAGTWSLGALNLCVQDDTTPAFASGTEQGQWRTFRGQLLLDAIIDKSNTLAWEAQAQVDNYYADVANFSRNFYSLRNVGPQVGTGPHQLFKHKDDHGFLAMSGFRRDGNRMLLTPLSVDEGSTVLFMIPRNTDPTFQFSDEVKALAEVTSHSVQSYGRAFSNGGSPSPSCPDTNFNSSMWSWTPGVDTKIDTITQGIAEDSFGVPIKVVDGIYSVKLPYFATKVKIYAYFEDGYGMVKTIDISDRDATEFKIQVGEINDVNEVVTGPKDVVF